MLWHFSQWQQLLPRLLQATTTSLTQFALRRYPCVVAPNCSLSVTFDALAKTYEPLQSSPYGFWLHLFKLMCGWYATVPLAPCFPYYLCLSSSVCLSAFICLPEFCWQTKKNIYWIGPPGHWLECKFVGATLCTILGRYPAAQPSHTLDTGYRTSRSMASQIRTIIYVWHHFYVCLKRVNLPSSSFVEVRVSWYDHKRIVLFFCDCKWPSSSEN